MATSGGRARRCAVAGSIALAIIGCRGRPETTRPSETTDSPGAPAASAPLPSGAVNSVPELAPGLHHETIVRPDGDRLRYTISVPDGYTRGVRPPLIVLLHYAGEVTQFYGSGMVSSLGRPAFTALRPILVAPDSLGGDWTTEQNEAAVVWLTRSVIATYGVDPARVVLTGYSMGGIGTWYLAGRHQDLFTAAIPVASAPVDDAEFRIPLYVIHSHDDEVLPIGPVAEYVDRLTARGVRVTWRPLRGPTHYDVARYSQALREASTWLAAQWAGGTAR